MLALPLRLEGGNIIDAAGDVIATLHSGFPVEYRERGAEIVAAVNGYAELLNLVEELNSLRNTRADLLAAAKRVVSVLDNYDPALDDLESSLVICGIDDELRAAIAKAEEA